MQINEILSCLCLIVSSAKQFHFLIFFGISFLKKQNIIEINFGYTFQNNLELWAIFDLIVRKKSSTKDTIFSSRLCHRRYIKLDVFFA